MPHMVVTLDTSHLEMSPSNLFDPGTGLRFASKNNQLISVTAETSQDPIGPCRPLEQSVGGNFRHSLMAVWSSALDFGAHPAMGMRYAVEAIAMLTILASVRRVRNYGYRPGKA